MIGDDGVDTRFQHRPDRPERTGRRLFDRVWCVGVLACVAVTLAIVVPFLLAVIA